VEESAADPLSDGVARADSQGRTAPPPLRRETEADCSYLYPRIVKNKKKKLALETYPRLQHSLTQVQEEARIRAEEEERQRIAREKERLLGLLKQKEASHKSAVSLSLSPVFVSLWS
jgi:hypothetical protein